MELTFTENRSWHWVVFAVVVAVPVVAFQPTCSRAQPRPSPAVIEIRGSYRYVYSNGLPDHPHGRFPNRGNPNRIRPQGYVFRVPLEPKQAPQPMDVDGWIFGVALNGIPFDPGTAEYWNNDRNSGWRYEALSGKINLGLDENHAHVQPKGAYHYHGIPTRLVDRLAQPDKMVLVGYAADGFPIYARYGHEDPMDLTSKLRPMRSSYRLKQGVRPDGPGGEYDGTFVQDYEYVLGSGDLDECNGRFGKTPEYPEGIYHYYLTDDFPFVPRLFRGIPDRSFQRHRPPPR